MGIHSPSRKIKTLNSVQDLSDVTFGHKFPRRGLKFLHWLANEWIEFNSERQMLAWTHPRTRRFGFHIFHNMENILPRLPGDQSSYFEVGNLHANGAEDLPFSGADTGSDESNTDRIIVRMDSNNVIGEVYITEHTPYQNSFSCDSTYRISRGLIMHIQKLEESDFLQRSGYIPEKNESPRSESRETAVNMEEEEEEDFPQSGGYIPGKYESPRSESRYIAVSVEEEDFPQSAGYIPRKYESPRSQSRNIAIDFPRRSSSIWDICNCVIL